MEKECEICGAFFTVTNAKQKYCSECRKHSDRKKRAMEKNIRKSIARYGNGTTAPGGTLEFTCRYCGATYLWAEHHYDKDFCSKRCSDKYKAEHRTCQCCGKRLGAEDDSRFCSSECEWEYHERRGEAFTCGYCGKAVIRPGGGKYCSRDCANKAQKGKERKKKAPEPRQEICPVCRKIYFTGSGAAFCSEECKRIFNAETAYAAENYRKKARAEKEALKQEARIQKQKAKEEYDQMQLERERQFTEKNGLCPTCRVPYMYCERMTSGFTASPEGSVFSGSIVVKCPKYVS